MDNIDIIFASKFKVAANAIKKLCSSAQIKCYTLTDDSENDYIFTDLRPTIFICTDSFFKDFADGVLNQLKSFDTIKVLCSDENDDDFDIIWPKDIDTFNFIDNVKELLIKEDIDG